MTDIDVSKMMKLVDLALNKPGYTYPMQLNARKPDIPFASVMKIKEHNPGQDKVETVEVEGVITTMTVGVRLIQFKVLFTEGDEEQSRFITSFRRQAILDFMASEDLAIMAHFPADNENLTLETNWEVRDGVLVTCMVRRTYTHEEQIIEESEITGTYNEGETSIDMVIHSSIK